MVTWRLDVIGLGGKSQTLADWKITNATLRTLNLGQDILSFTIPKADVSENPICAFGATARLFREEGGLVKWFEGRRILTPFDATAAGESHTYTFANAWQYLNTNVFQQPWYSGIFTPHLIVLGSVGFNIKVVLDYAMANGAALQYQAADLTALGVTPPANEVTGKTCASVILDLLQFAPDTAAWWDYSTDPPTIRFGQRPNLKAVDLSMANANPPFGSRISATRIMAREDLQVPAVKICFETIVTTNGKPRLVPGVEIWPPGATGREDGALSDVVVLQGRTITTVQATLFCETIDVDSLEWWKRVVPALADPRVVPGSLGFTAVQRTRIGRDGQPSLMLPRMLVEGQCEEWMINPPPDNSVVVWQEEEIKGEFFYEVWGTPGDGLSKIKQKLAEPHTFHCTSTNAPEGETFYDSLDTVEEGDPVVVGLAKYLYDSLNPLQWEVTVNLVEPECTGAVHVGNVVNIIGLRPEFAAMRALVQEVVFALDSGETQVNCGPARHLSVNEILAILRANRFRRRWTNPSTQTDGEVAGGGSVRLGRGMPNTNTIPSNDLLGFLAILAPANSKQIQLDAVGGTGSVFITLSACQGKDLSIREVGVCENGIEKRILVLASATY